MAELGYRQWLGALPGQACYQTAAQEALNKAKPFAEGSPAVARFCALLTSSLDTPLQPLDLRMPKRTRRGGAQARRLAL